MNCSSLPQPARSRKITKASFVELAGLSFTTNRRVAKQLKIALAPAGQKQSRAAWGCNVSPAAPGAQDKRRLLSKSRQGDLWPDAKICLLGRNVDRYMKHDG